MDFLRLQGVVGSAHRALLPLKFGHSVVGRIHLLDLEGLSIDRGLEVLHRRVDHAQFPVMVGGVNLFRVGDSAEQAAQIGQALHLGPLGEDQITHVGHTLPGKGLL